MENNIWQECLLILQREMTSQQYNTWIRPLKVLSDEQDICLLAPNKFIADWIKDKFLQRMEEIICELSPSSKETPMIYLAAASPRLMSFKIAGKLKKPDLTIIDYSAKKTEQKHKKWGEVHQTKNKATTVINNAPPEKKAPVEIKISDEEDFFLKNNLNDKYTFENFVKGESNKVALSSALKVVDSPGQAYNPLFLYGGVGLGKTHLMHAVGNSLFDRNQSIKIIYLHAERFVRDMVKSLQIKSINNFKKYYRSADILLIDDIQFFSGKVRSQEEFFHTFNDLLDGGQQVILTCDRYPEKISGINERLRSRFGRGLTVAIEIPDLKTRIAILKQKAKKNKAVLPDSVAAFIASRLKTNIRELEGALKRVMASSIYLNKQISIDLAKDALKDVIDIYDTQLEIIEIQNTISSHYKISVADLVSKSRNKAIVYPRQMGMAISKELTSCSLFEIGQAFGGRDHTTVMHACSKIQQLVKCNTEMHKEFLYLIKQLVK